MTPGRRRCSGGRARRGLSFLGLTAGVRLFDRPPVALGGWVGRRCARERWALRCLAAPRCACCLRWPFCFCWALGRCGGRRWALRCLAAPRCACCLRWPFCFRWALGLFWAPRSRAVFGVSLLLLVAVRPSTFHGVWVGPAAASAGTVTGPRKTTAARGHSHERSVRWIRFIDCLRFCVERHDNAMPSPFQGHASGGGSSPAEPPAATFFLSPGPGAGRGAGCLCFSSEVRCGSMPGTVLPRRSHECHVCERYPSSSPA